MRIPSTKHFITKGSNKLELSQIAETEIYCKKKREYTTLQKAHINVIMAVMKVDERSLPFVMNINMRLSISTSPTTMRKLSKYTKSSNCLSTLHEENSV